MGDEGELRRSVREKGRTGDSSIRERTNGLYYNWTTDRQTVKERDPVGVRNKTHAVSI